MSMTLAEYEAYLRSLAERIENVQPVQQNITTKPAKKKRLIKKQFHHKKQQ